MILDGGNDEEENKSIVVVKGVCWKRECMAGNKWNTTTTKKRENIQIFNSFFIDFNSSKKVTSNKIKIFNFNIKNSYENLSYSEC